jgi:two-component system, sensor histidine kinase LadS
MLFSIAGHVTFSRLEVSTALKQRKSVLAIALLMVWSQFVSLLNFIARLQTALLQLLAWVIILFATPAQAQLVSLPSAGLELTKLEVLHDVPMGLTLAQVQSGQVDAFVPQDSLQISHPHWYRAMWLRLHIKAKANLPAQPEQAVLFFPKPYLDGITLYTPTTQADQPWNVQRAGDSHDPATWPTRSLHPKFLLPSASTIAARDGQSMVLYVQMDHIAPVILDLNFDTASHALDQESLALLVYGIGFGTILLAAALTAMMAWLYRDEIYGWYCLYSVSALLACMSHSGVAHHVLWPINGPWPGTAVLCFMLLCGICQMQFSRCVNAYQADLPWLRKTAHICSVACLLLLICFGLFPTYWQSMYFMSLGLMAIAMLISAGLMLQGWRTGHALARVWLLAYMPLFGTVILALLEGIGILPSSYWIYSLVIYAAIFEVLVLGLALQWFARERHGEHERLKTLAAVDPLTGFVTTQAFQSQLLRDWHSRQHLNRHLAVAYIQLQTRAQNDQQMQQMLTRCVRVLRSATGMQDVVARLDGQLLALLMHDVPMGDELNQRLSRIIALGLMPDASQSQASILQFRIAATTREHYAQPLAKLDEDLRALLAQPKGWGSKPIRYLDRASSQPAAVVDLNSQQLDQFWDRALGHQIASETDQLAGATTAPSPLR